MALSVVLFLLCAGIIYLSCEYFVNGVEWVGRRLNLGATTTGTVLAAFGTALPESAVTFVAVVFGHDAAQKNIERFRRSRRPREVRRTGPGRRSGHRSRPGCAR